MQPTSTYIYMTVSNSKPHWLLWSMYTTKLFLFNFYMYLFVLVHCTPFYVKLFSVNSL